MSRLHMPKWSGYVVLLTIAAAVVLAAALDPAIIGNNFPDQFASFKKTAIDTDSTPYGGSKPFDKLERDPSLKRLYAGYAFAVEYNEERGHYYALVDQQTSKRVEVASQPGACANCHASEAPELIEQMGWETFCKTPLKELSGKLHHGTSCVDCHDPDTMELRISRRAFIEGMAQRGVDVTNASQQLMKSYVCGQCHSEYYFKGENKLLTFPWKNGLTIDDIENYYNEVGFSDWTHAETGGPILKVQHPDLETWSTGIHAKSGVSCVDCHMAKIKSGDSKYTDHQVRSPLLAGMRACKVCHQRSEKDLRDRVALIQDRTAGLLKDTEVALIDAIDAIKAAKQAGATSADLTKAYQLYRSAQLRWDFVSSENGMGFHSPQEAARILATSIDRARQAQLAAVQFNKKID